MCGYPHDDATSAQFNEARPKPGDISICAGCGVIATFDEDLRVVPMTEHQANEMLSNPKMVEQLKRVVGVIHFLNETAERRN